MHRLRRAAPSRFVSRASGSGEQCRPTTCSAPAPLAIALNARNRKMGLVDPYPFVMAEPAVQKLRFVDQDDTSEGLPATGGWASTSSAPRLGAGDVIG
jgi:hypothetical protein